MRLINAQTLELEEFFGDQIPEYAILSHTWGPPKDEVSFQDMTSKNFEHKAGIRKIRFLCQQALQDDLVWTWCDTCCINKDSSAELSEAINSMFQWYQDAKICYAYLSDVDASANLDATTSSRFSVPPEFSISRWFSRGWTLQELLAPEEVIFFARDWICIGRKKELFWLIRRITGIHRGALEWPWTISSYSVATRISWAARRKTTRTEDRAYSLLGILGVHMPLLYGEARNAFKRLQTELIKISDDESLFAHSGPNILADMPDAFIVESERYTLSRSNQHKPYSITNMGLSIEIPIVFLPKLDGSPSAKCRGILNCHDGQDYKHFLSIPLQETSLKGVLIRSPGPVEPLQESLVQQAKRTSVMIKFTPPEISSITYLPELRGSLIREYKSLAHVCTSSVLWQFRENRVTLQLNPKREAEFEMVVHVFSWKSAEGSFVVTIIFEHSGADAGLLIYTGEEHDALGLEVSDMLFAAWEDKGKPAKEEIQITGKNGEVRKIEAMIALEPRLNQAVWVLSLEVTDVSPNLISPSMIVPIHNQPGSHPTTSIPELPFHSLQTKQHPRSCS